MNGFQIDAVNNALDEARTEIKRLTLLHEISERQAQLENERLQRHATSMIDAMKAENERLRLTPEQAYLQVVEGWLRNNRGIFFTEGAVDDLCKRIASALEPQP